MRWQSLSPEGEASWGLLTVTPQGWREWWIHQNDFQRWWFFKGDSFSEAESVGELRRGAGVSVFPGTLITRLFLKEAFWTSLRPGQVFPILCYESRYACTAVICLYLETFCVIIYHVSIPSWMLNFFRAGARTHLVSSGHTTMPGT